ncbi:MAG: pyruvate, phosphate dikinase [Candidatus Gastranaerophilales bacterium]|nr:pyruvate, phosphate dikinase [Candidatus Gastranaerophilales bacterium]
MRIFYSGTIAPPSNIDQKQVSQLKMQAPLQRDTVCFTSRPDKVNQVSFKGPDSIGNIEQAIFSNKEGATSNKNILGGKGYGLAEMAGVDLPVPPFFTLSTEICKLYQKENKLPDDLMPKVLDHMREMEQQENKKFGDPENPILVSVRSGAPVSMPGMMDTVLNLGLNDETVQGVAKQGGNSEEAKRFAYDSYRRFISMFGNIVLDLKEKDRNGNDVDLFAKKLEEYKEEKSDKLGRKAQDTDLDVNDLKSLIKDYKNIVKEKTGKDFPQDVNIQLELAIDAVFGSWNTPRAAAYRREFKISDDLGTAVNVCSMVFGNMNDNSGTGVLFTRDPDTGEKGLYGDYLTRAQGEDVVAGIRPTKPIKDLETEMPDTFKELTGVCDKLEHLRHNMQDIEFTVQNGKLYLLQTRDAKRSAKAQIKTAIDLYNEGLVDNKAKALDLIEPNRIREALLPIFDPKEAKNAVKVTSGLNASPGCGTGKIVFNPEEAEERGLAGEKVILVRPETSPDDVAGMFKSQGVVTTRGGRTSHAAVVAKQAGKPCVVADEKCKVDLDKETFTTEDGTVYRKNDIISVDGTSGNIYKGAIKTIMPELDDDFKTIISWAKEVIGKNVQIRANADNGKDSKAALEMGADGIGLCRTEHMFMDKSRLPVVQEMIIADTPEARKAALEKLLPMQRQDFKEIFEVMGQRPVTIRLLDPPLHEFLPKHDDLLIEVNNLEHEINRSKGSLSDAAKLEAELAEKKATLEKVNQLKEQNPMMGLRGCRLGLTFPEISEMQIRAIVEAACESKKEGNDVHPEIMIPLTTNFNELKAAKDQVDSVAKQVMEEKGIKVDYKFGTMIETPRAALIADKLASICDFFSFGTNDLTQMTWGFSRDDTSKLVQHYVDKKLMDNESDPFDVLDPNGVGQLMKIAVDKAKPVLEKQGRLDTFKISICGEHGGEAESVKTALGVGLNCTSASPYRVPTSIISAAQKVSADKKSA